MRQFWRRPAGPRLLTAGIEMARRRTRARMGALYTPNQVLGRAMSIGCAAVEITQRCNLDCTLCYLSNHSQSVRDLPIEEIYRRIDAVRDQFGAGANIQITGGDPTLRRKSELLGIVRYARDCGLYPALFTNGIAASRKLLTQLADNGLSDVAFHVDTTQQRPRYATEQDLNAIRRRYIERARGLPLMVVFNTTVHAGNLAAVPDLVRFFSAYADVVGFASFQLQAETGRGQWGARDAAVSLEKVRERIADGADTALAWDALHVGHPRCHSYVPTVVVDGKIHDLIDDSGLCERFLEDFADVPVDRRRRWTEHVLTHLGFCWRRPVWLWHGARYLGRFVWRARRELLHARGRVHKLSFFIQNFMDAAELDAERIRACSFMVMTADGPLSMCEHNSRRNEFILEPITIAGADGRHTVFHPLAPSAPIRDRDRPRDQETDWMMASPRYWVFLMVIVAGGAFADAAVTDAPTHALWRPVLQRFVDDQGRIDFIGLSRDRALLDRFVAYLAQVSPSSHPERFATPEAVLAYHINAYNALAMYGVLQKGIPRGFDGVFKRLRFFRLQKFQLGGRSIDLYNYENKVIRPLGEPRIHFALNCMVRDCPRLPREPFVAERLDAQLELAAREFFNKARHIRVDEKTSTLWLSEILDFYTEDFITPKTPTLIDYVNLYRDAAVQSPYRVRFLPYDWTINQSPS